MVAFVVWMIFFDTNSLKRQKYIKCHGLMRSKV